MLEQLSIDNYALIERANLHFSSGLNVFSGETGAGKSIFIEALNLALGARSDGANISHANRAQICAVFNDLPLDLQLQLKNLDLSDVAMPAQCIFRRSISKTSNERHSARSYVNDFAISATKIKQLQRQLLIIYGQHHSLSLAKNSEQLLRFDRFAGALELRHATKKAFQNLQLQRAEYELWQREQQPRQQRLQFLEYQCEEIAKLEIKTNEFIELSNIHRRLSNAENTIAVAGEVLANLAAAEQKISNSISKLRQLSNVDNAFENIAAMTLQSHVYINEVLDDLQRNLEEQRHDAPLLQQVENRMSILHDLARKHRCKVDDLNQLLQQLENERQQIVAALAAGAQLAQRTATAQQKYQQIATKLSQQRQCHCEKFAREITAIIAVLGMQNAKLRVVLQRGECGECGIDDLKFEFCANLGQPYAPLTKAASGGELARIALAIEVICVAESGCQTIIFDEIDSGIGGEIGDTIGKLLLQLAQKKQVLCITHLAQVAVYAERHFAMYKSTNAEKTRIFAKLIEKEQRVTEIARMLGAKDDPSSKAHAKHMLRRVDKSITS